MVGDGNTRFGVVRGRKVDEGDVNVFTLGSAFVDERLSDFFGDFAFLVSVATSDPSDLNVRHGDPFVFCEDSEI